MLTTLHRYSIAGAGPGFRVWVFNIFKGSTNFWPPLCTEGRSRLFASNRRPPSCYGSLPPAGSRKEVATQEGKVKLG